MKRRRRKSRFSSRLFLFTVVLVIITYLAATSTNDKLGLGINIPTISQLGQAGATALKSVTTMLSDPDAEVHFIDVGNADATFIKSGDTAVLIDGGNNENGQQIVEYLRREGVQTLDYVIATHAHADHIGGLDVVIDNLDVDNVIMTQLSEDMIPTTNTYRSLLESIVQRDCHTIAATPGESYALDGGKLTILAPLREYDDLNDTSVVVKFEYGAFSALIGGDATKASETDILRAGYDLKSIVYKVQHHGSKTSNSQLYLDKIDAEYYVVPVGKDNAYNHPHTEVMKRLEKTKKPIYRADYNGDVVFTLKGDTLKVTLEKE